MTRKVLGKGLSSLIPGPPVAIAPPPPLVPYVEIDLDRVDPNPSQPRENFPEAELEELAASIAQHGVVQPIVVRRRGDRYQIVVGERRLRASQRAGLRKIPAVVREIPDDKMLEVALVENIQRQELDPVEEAHAYRALIDTLGLSHADIAERVGKDRSTVSNSLRLLSLSENIQVLLRAGSIAPGHARALLVLPEERRREALARRVVAQGLSVRQTERIVAGRGNAAKAARPAAPNDANTRHAEERMMRTLGTRVRIVRQGEGGRVEISFHNEEELERLFEQIVG